MSGQAGRLTWRLALLGLVLLLGTGGLVFRLVQLQILEHPEYQLQAHREHQRQRQIYAPRGDIVDRNGLPLATSIPAYDLYASRVDWQEKPGMAMEAAEGLAPVLQEPSAGILRAVLNAEAAEVLLAQGIPYEVGRSLQRKELTGVRLVQSSRRVYPEGSIAAPLLGFVGYDRVGLTGIEADFDQVLAGTPGLALYEEDSRGVAIPFGERSLAAPEPGGRVTLTIDRYIQRQAEQELDRAIQQYDAKGGAVIVMDPRTGEILALASRPTFDLTRLDFNDAALGELARLRPVTDLYEPGSVFKLVTVAAALDAGVITPSTTYDDTGAYRASDYTIYNWDRSVNGLQTVTQVLTKSLNTGAAWISQRLGAQSFYEYVARFGFGSLTGMGLPGEAPGQLRRPGEPEWSPVDLATNSFGQGLGVTPLQVIAAVAAVANGGQLMRPYIVSEIDGPDGHQAFAPTPVRRVISRQTAETLTQMMVEVAGALPAGTDGLGRYQVAGKTGTATIPEGGSYESGRIIVSFAGFVPVGHPRIVILVKIDEPVGQVWGSTVAAPVFQRLAVKVLAYLNVPPDLPAQVRRD